MYRSSPHRQVQSRFGHKSYQGRGLGGGNKIPKKLDPKLFVRKAVDMTAEAEYEPATHFADLPIVDKIKRNILDHGYTTPTAIQDKAMSLILSGRDLIGVANTGTGKTAAFLITLLNKCYLDHNQRVLIVVPTRELAIQIEDEFHIFAKGLGLDIASIIGGANIQRQTYALHHKPNFVVGTPGRLKDLVDRHVLNLSFYQNVVLDEVDRMVDIGFIQIIRYLISFLPKVRQSLFFSATVDGKTQDLLRGFVTDPVTVTVKHQDTADNIDQDIVRLAGGQSKIDALHDLLISPGFDKVIIFGRTKWGMDKLSRSLKERGFQAATIHGNKSQNQRQRALDEFKQERHQILIATDVASRGLDIENVTHVINYDPPESYDDYIHRIGRTGRAGKRGVALTFVD